GVGVPVHVVCPRACASVCALFCACPDECAGDVCEELPLPLEHFLQRMARRPRPQQFFGLMGKRDAGEQGGGLGHKTDSFVGLMGKRSLNSGIRRWKSRDLPLTPPHFSGQADKHFQPLPAFHFS
uniref:Tachykinin precursor 1 n=1 Tax=Bubo bubo TaxID=30461 RepID=A0A8C0FHZ9_BUBBB